MNKKQEFAAAGLPDFPLSVMEALEAANRYFWQCRMDGSGVLRGPDLELESKTYLALCDLGAWRWKRTMAVALTAIGEVHEPAVFLHDLERPE